MFRIFAKLVRRGGIYAETGTDKVSSMYAPTDKYTGPILLFEYRYKNGGQEERREDRQIEVSADVGDRSAWRPFLSSL